MYLWENFIAGRREDGWATGLVKSLRGTYSTLLGPGREVSGASLGVEERVSVRANSHMTWAKTPRRYRSAGSPKKGERTETRKQGFQADASQWMKSVGGQFP